MNSNELNLSPSGATQDVRKPVDSVAISSKAPGNPPLKGSRLFRGLPPFWWNRLIEAGLILSMALYYIIGNKHLGNGHLFALNPLLSLPFLLIFAGLCWYRLSFAVALLPLTLPYYLQQKTVFSHYSFSMAEIAVLVCFLVAVIQFGFQRGRWQYRLSWQELLDRLGPFALPILLFFLAAALSVFIAYNHVFALRAFREEVFEPLLYVLLALFCLRTRQDVMRLLMALLASGLVVALIGMAQYFLFRNQLVLEDGIRRVHAMYGSANSIGLFFDYVLPFGVAMALAQTSKARESFRIWWLRMLAIAICLPLLLVLYLSQSRGAWVAVAVAAIFILALSIRNRKVLLIGGLVVAVVLGAVFIHYYEPITSYMIAGHTDVSGVSTLEKRLWLWRSAWRMITARPWFGFGMDNWLCYYSGNTVCHIPASIQPFHYWILYNPVTHAPTGLGEEPLLSHPHNIFLHVWVSMGIFGLLAFVAVLVLFFWLFTRILISLRSARVEGSMQMQWMTIGVGATMVAAIIQGQVDSSFLEQDLAYCFWMLVTALLLLRVLSATPWRGRLKRGYAVTKDQHGERTE